VACQSTGEEQGLEMEEESKKYENQKNPAAPAGSRRAQGKVYLLRKDTYLDFTRSDRRTRPRHQSEACKRDRAGHQERGGRQGQKMRRSPWPQRAHSIAGTKEKKRKMEFRAQRKRLAKVAKGRAKKTKAFPIPVY